MKISADGLSLIKKNEGCRLEAYKPVATEKCYTIGYGHYGSDVLPGMVITHAQAEALLLTDLQKYEKYVNDTGLTLNQCQFDALVSFTYNCGVGNLKKLIRGRSLTQIADAMLSFNKGSGKVLPGLTRRRKEERALFLKDTERPPTGNPYAIPTKSIRLHSKGNGVRWLQFQLNSKGGYKLLIDGEANQLTIGAVLDWQKKHHPPLEVDGIAGENTIDSLL